MGTSFKGAMADGLDAGQSIAKSFRSGVTGAMDFTKKRAEVFANNMVRNAKNISKAFQHPIKNHPQYAGVRTSPGEKI